MVLMIVLSIKTKQGGVQQTPPQAGKDSRSPRLKNIDQRSNWGSHIVKIPVEKSSMEKIPIGKSFRSFLKDRQKPLSHFKV